MEILKKDKKVLSDRFEKINRNMRWANEIISKGSVREFSRDAEGRRLFQEMGGFSDWSPLGVPDMVDVVCVTEIQLSDDWGRQRQFLPGDTVTLDREKYIFFSKNLGQVMPVDPTIPALSFFLPMRYERPEEGPSARQREEQLRQNELLEKERRSWLDWRRKQKK